MTLYRANFDYESELFWGKKDDWAVELLEHLFFFCADKSDTLHTTRSYPRDYMEFIRSAMGFTPKTSSLGEPENWWGSLKNLDTEKRLNSKVTSFEIANNLKLNHSKSRLIVNYKELSDFFEEIGDVFLRHPYERAGRVSFRLHKKEQLEKNKEKLARILKEQPLLGDAFFKDRAWDLGTCFRQDDGRFDVKYQIKNLNDGLGVFRGAILLEENIDSEELDKICDAYYKLGARDFIQIDSFSYGEGINWLVEVNYRKTMGYILHKLNRLCPLDSSVAFLVTPASWIKKFYTHKKLQQTLDDLEGVFPLSPVDNPLYCWLVYGKDRDELLERTREFWGLVAKNADAFPSIYEKILPEQASPEIKTPI